MRIIKLEFENINSLKGLQSIDFTQPPLSNSGLFLIAGPTGSGKSTILDAITLALFNKIPRFNSPISVNQIVKLGSVVTHFENNAMSSITYESNGKQYNSTWSLSKNRNDNWRDYHMEIYELSNKNIFDLKKSEVPEHNEQLIGLKYEQFLKSILLSQGEFSQFLKADHNTRGALLEKLTGTEIYRKIGELAYSRWKTEKELIEIELNEINAIPILDQAEVNSKQEDQNDIQIEIAKLEQDLKLLHLDIQTKSNLSEISRQVKSLADAITAHNDKIEQFKPFEHKLKNHNALSPLTSDLALVRNKKEDLVRARIELKQAGIQQKKYTESLALTIESMSILIKGKVTQDSFIREMKALEKKYIELITIEKGLLEDGKVLRQRINKKVESIDELSDKMAPKEALKVIDDRVVAFNSKRKTIQSDDHLQSLIETITGNAELIKEQIQFGEEYGLLTKNIRDFNEEIESLELSKVNLDAEIIKLQPAIVSKKSELVLKEKEILQHQKKMDLSEFRAALKSEEPCPLCGSITHPYKMHGVIFEEGKLSIELRILKEEIEHLNSEILSKSTLASALQSKITEKKTSNEKDTLKLKNLLSQAKIKNIEVESLVVNDLKNQAISIIEELGLLKQLLKEESLIAVYNVVKQDYAGLDTILKKYTDIKTELKTLYDGGDLINKTNNLQDNFNESVSNINKCKDAVNRLTQYVSESEAYLTNKEALVQFKLDKIGIESIELAEQLILTSEEYEQLESKRTLLNTIKIEQETNLQQLRKNQLQLKEKVTDEKTIETLENLLVSMQDQRNEKLQTIGKLQEQLKVNQHNEHLKALKLSAIEEQKIKFDKWVILNGVIGDSTGNKFANYAQDLTLRTLISIANTHLSSLSDRYQMVSTSIDEDLAIYDTYQGDTIRSISTLSGGETFIVSLAMAVSLSELASRNVKIESIFIDEGFGTLDAESLEQAMNTLEILQANSNKTIGIISHVDSLKERLTTQIQLSKNNKGYSSINIVG